MLTQKVINENIKKCHTNNNNYITVGINTTGYVNLYIYEQILSYLNQKQSPEDARYTSYYLYKKGQITLHLNDNGSSNCFNEIIKYTNKITEKNCTITFNSYFNRKMNNDSFESSYIYDNIDYIESLTYTLHNVDIELLKINNEYSIRILISPDSSSQNIYNVVNILINIIL